MERNHEVDEITLNLKNQIRLKGLVCDVPEFAPLKNGAVSDTLAEAGQQHLEESAYCTHLLETTPVEYRREITSHFSVLLFLVAPIKKLIRKLMRFLLEPMVQEINSNRQMTATALFELQECVRECEESLCMMHEMLTNMQAEMDALKTDNLYLKESIQSFRKEEAASCE